MAHRDWFDALDTGDDHPVIVEAHGRLGQVASYRVASARARETSAALASMLDAEHRQVWLAADAAANERWEQVAAAYYNVGVDHGRSSGGEGPARLAGVLREIAIALVRAAAKLEG